MSKDNENYIVPAEWTVYEIRGHLVRPVEIKVGESTVYAILFSNNDIFVPVNSRSGSDILEKMKENNRKFVTPKYGLYYVEPLKDFLGVPLDVNKDGCRISSPIRLGSTGIQFSLLNPEPAAVVVFDRLHRIFPHLIFSKGTS